MEKESVPSLAVLSSAAPDTPIPESTALEALKAKLNDPACPTLELARSLQAHLQIYPQSRLSLAEKLGMSEKRTYFSELIGLLRLSSQADLEGKVLTLREIRNLTVDPTVDSPLTSRKTAVDSVNQGVDNGYLGVDNGYLGVDKTVDRPKNQFKHGERSQGGGASPDKTVGELLVSILVGIIFVPAYAACWLVHQRGYDDLCELEERAHRKVLSYGAWNVIRWVAVGLICLIVLGISWPRLRQAIRDWRRLPVAPAAVAKNDPVGVGPRAHPSEPNRSIELEGRAQGPAPTTTTIAAPLHPPTGLHYTAKTPDFIILEWQAVGPGVTYNVYSSGSRDLTGLRKENNRPMTYNSVNWTPETGLDRYWIAVTALDAQGHESAYSEAIEVVRYPAKKENTLLQDAAGVLRRVVQ